MVISMFSGCSANEMSVFEGIMKGVDIQSYEDTANLTFNVAVTGASEEDMNTLQPMIDLINSSSVTLNQKVAMNPEKADVNGKFNLLLNTSDSTTNFDVWFNSGIKDGEFKYKEIIKMPSLMKDSLPSELSDKEYLVSNSDYMESLGQMSSLQMAESFKTFDTEVKNSLIQFAKDYSFNKEVIKYVGDEDFNGEAVKVYQLDLNDQLFKEWIHYMVDLGIKKDYIANLLNSYFNVLESVTAPTGENEILQSEINAIEDQVGVPMTDEEKSAYLNEIDTFFNDIQDIPVIGDKGIVINFKINSDGYIVASNGNMNFVVDLKKWNEKYPDIENETGTLPIINLNVGFAENMTNINKDIVIDTPNANYSNSIDVADLDDPSRIKVFLNDNRVYFDVDPVIQNSRTLVPVRKIAEEMNMDVQWNQSKKTVTATKNGTTIVLKINDKKAYVNGKLVYLDVPAKIVNGRTIIPVRFFSEKLNSVVNWDGKTRTVLINTINN